MTGRRSRCGAVRGCGRTLASHRGSALQAPAAVSGGPSPASGRLLPRSHVRRAPPRLPWPTACFFPALGDTPLSGQAGVGAPSPTAGRLGDFRVGTAVNIECGFPCGRALGKLQRVRWPGWGAASVSCEEPPGRLQSGRSVRRAHRQRRVLPAPGAPGRASDGCVAPSPGLIPRGAGQRVHTPHAACVRGARRGLRPILKVDRCCSYC